CQGPITSCLCIDDIECLLIGQNDGSFILFNLMSANVMYKIQSSCKNSQIETSSFICLKQPHLDTFYIIVSRTNKNKNMAFLTVEKIKSPSLLKNSKNTSLNSMPVCKISINPVQSCDPLFRLHISQVVVLKPSAFSFTVTISSLNCVNSYLVIFDLNIFSTASVSNDIKLNASSVSLFSDYYHIFLDIRRLVQIPYSIAIHGSISLFDTIPKRIRAKAGLSVFTASDYMVDLITIYKIFFVLHHVNIFLPHLSLENLLSIAKKLFNSVSKKIVRALSGGNVSDLKFHHEIHTNLLEFYSEIVKFDGSLGYEKGIEITTWLSFLGFLREIYNFCVEFKIDEDKKIEIDHKDENFFIFHVFQIINSNLKEANKGSAGNLTLASTFTLRDLFNLVLIKSEIPIFMFYIYYIVRNYLTQENFGVCVFQKFIKILKIDRDYINSFKSLWYIDQGYYAKGVKAWFKVNNKIGHSIVHDQNFLIINKAVQFGKPSHLISKLVIETIISSKNRCLKVFFDYLVQHTNIEYILSNLQNFLRGPVLLYLWFFLAKYEKIVLFVSFLSLNTKYQHIYRQIYYEIPSSIPYITVFEKINPIKLNLNKTNFDEIRNCKDKVIRNLANLSLHDSQDPNHLCLMKNAVTENHVSQKNFLLFMEQISDDLLESVYPKTRRNIQESDVVLPNIKYLFNKVFVNHFLDMRYFWYFSKLQVNILESTRGPSDFPLLSPSKEHSQKSGKSSDIFYPHEPVTINLSPPSDDVPFRLISIDESIISPPLEDSKKSSRIHTKRINKITEGSRKYNLRARNTTSNFASPAQSTKLSRVVDTNMESNIAIKSKTSKVGKRSQLQNRTAIVENYLTGGDYIQLRSRRVENLSSTSSIVSSLRSRKSMKLSPVKENTMPKRTRIKK
ncbi:hypothetical protein MXB_3120, partial [Myxobolus squamalis]